MRHRNLLLSLLCAGTTLYSQNPVPSGPPRLEDGSPIKLRLQRTMSSGSARVNEQVDFEVLEEIKVGGVVVVPKGGIAWGTVTEAQPKRRMARGGKLDINIDSVRLADGEKTALRAVQAGSGGGHAGAMTGAIVATSLIIWPAAPFFLFMHGKDITIPKGTEITAYVNGDKELDLAKFDAPHAAPAGSTPPPARTLASPEAVSLIASGGGSQSDGPLTEGHFPSTDPSTVVVKSDPDGAEIIVDGKFFGNTPSTVQLTPGPHLVSMQKPGFRTWQREVAITSGGIISLNGNLEKAVLP